MHPLIRSVWDEPRPPQPPARDWRDWALVAGAMVAGTLEGALRPELPWRVLCVLIVVGSAPTLLWRRSQPLLVVAIVFTVLGLLPLVMRGTQPQINSLAYVLILLYALVRWGSGREVVIGATIVFVQILLSLPSDDFGLSDVLSGFVVLSLVGVLAQTFRSRAGARVREIAQVKLLERERLARDLHDTVAHHVSAIAIRAQAGLATAASQPDAATDALRVIEAEASRTLIEMRAMVHVLRRDQPAELAPSRQLTDLAELAGRPRTGPLVEVEIAGALGELPPSVGAALFRLAQESITNARRHARHATRIVVRVDADDTTVHLRVSDDGDPNPERPAAEPGYGLIGMIERVTLLGGTCEAGPDPDRGWTVTAVLPRKGWAA